MTTREAIVKLSSFNTIGRAGEWDDVFEHQFEKFLDSLTQDQLVELELLPKDEE